MYFYCHFPDLLLATNRSSLLTKLYRFPLDLLEEITTGTYLTLLSPIKLIVTGFANYIAVNSVFTMQIFHRTFQWVPDHWCLPFCTHCQLNILRISPFVLYPAVNMPPVTLQKQLDGYIAPPAACASAMILNVNQTATFAVTQPI